MKRMIIVLGLVMSAAAVPAPALSQGIEIGPDGVRILEPRGPDRVEGRRDRRDRREISERDAVRIARSEGVREVDEVVARRGTYRVLGADRRGRDIRVDIDRRSGEVISVR